MKRLVCLLGLILYSFHLTSAQKIRANGIELTATAGTTHFFGDIGGYPTGENLLGLRDITRYNTGINLSGNARYRFSEAVSARLNLAGGIFNVSDRIGSNESRGFEASSGFFEASVAGEFFFLRNKIDGRYNGRRKQKNGKHPFGSYLDSYLFAGFGAIFFDVDPNAALAMRRTTGDEYAFVLPAGAGVTRKTGSSSKIGIEIGGRYVFADKPDGYSFPGSNNDIYYFANLTWTWKL